MPHPDSARTAPRRTPAPASARGGSAAARPSSDVAVDLAPFVAWLATRERDEGLRRRYHAHVETYLRHLLPRDRPGNGSSRQRYEAALTEPLGRRAEIHAALDRFAEHRRILHLTRTVADDV